MFLMVPWKIFFHRGRIQTVNHQYWFEFFPLQRTKKKRGHLLARINEKPKDGLNAGMA